ncbi:MAG: class I tRNA ligase family protein, partial [Candidatus Paceibacteria bacterium]
TNFALAVGTSISYVTVSIPDTEKQYVVAEELVDTVFEGYAFEITERYTGENLIGKEYTPLFDFFAQEENRFFVYEGFHVTTEGGTGIVHLAPYGAEDLEIFSEIGIQAVDVLDEEGNFTEQIPAYQGQFYRDANTSIIEDLKHKERLFKHEDYEHQMPICWRTKTPLIYKPITAWYVAVTKIKDQILANNENVGWIPSHMKHGRFGNWLENAKDWNVSRNRYWATPMPIWRGEESGDTIVIGSYKELESYGATAPEDPHRPFVDEITFECNGETYRRIPDVLDVWYDSGAMPFARFHYPFENTDTFENTFPAEYVAEGLDQTRGWFYSLIVLGTALFGDAPYNNVMVNGLVLADDGSKLSKSKKNYQPPQEMLDTYGADAVRLNFFATPISSGEDTIVSPNTLQLYVQEYLLPIWNMMTFLITYANANEWEPISEQEFDPYNLEHALDRWMYTRL